MVHLLYIVQNSHVQYYSVQLPKELGLSETETLKVSAAYTHAVHPFPREVIQNGPQAYEFAGNVYFLSPYPIEKTKTNVK
jgi:oligosaccharyltransferase complex subunit alpha (ribophorin I)